MTSVSAAPTAETSRSSAEATSDRAPRGIDGFMARVDPRLQPWIVFLRAHAAVSRALEAELEAEQSMSLADYEALIQLAHADGRRLRMSELADRMILTRSGISRLVDRLEAGRYVERVACSTDARGAFAVLTDAGYERLQAASPTHLRGVDEHFLRAIPQADREAFVRVLTDILDGLERIDQPVDEACAI
jgi:DNA-binding MarR family transcriptional regulator